MCVKHPRDYLEKMAAGVPEIEIPESGAEASFQPICLGPRPFAAA